MAWVENNYSELSVSAVILGFMTWIIGFIFAIPLPSWPGFIPYEFVHHFVPRFNMIGSPLFALFVLIHSCIIIAQGFEIPRKNLRMIVLPIIGATLAFMYLAYEALGFLLFVTMDF